jgi:hypothetical protein
VCREAKPAAVYISLLRQYSLEGETVLDFFLGGQGLKMSLLKGCKCLAFVDSERIKKFLDVYTESLIAILEIAEFYRKTGALNKCIGVEEKQEGKSRPGVDDADLDVPTKGFLLQDLNKLEGPLAQEFQPGSTIDASVAFDTSEFGEFGKLRGCLG